MKVNNKKLIDFLKKVKMEGINQITETIFNFGETGLKITAMSAPNTVRVDAVLHPSAFSKYEAIGKIGIQDMPTIIKILNKFGEEVEIVVEGNIIRFKDKLKEMTTELMDTQFIKEVGEMKNFEFDEQFTIDVKEIQTTIDDASVNKEFTLRMETIEKGLTISSDGKYKFKRYFNINECKGGVNIKVGIPFIEGVTNLTDDTVISLKNNFPVKILEKTNESVISLIIAPLNEK